MRQVEHFAGGSAPAGWTVMTNGTGAVTFADSRAVFTLSAANDCAALYKPFDHTRNQIIAVCMRGNQAGPTPNPTFQIVHKATAPVPDVIANFLSPLRPQTYGATNTTRLAYTDTGGTNQLWEHATSSWKTANTTVSMPFSIPTDDYRIQGIHWDATNQRARMFAMHAAEGTVENADFGPKLLALTDWVPFSALQNGTSSTLWLILGWPHTDKFSVAGALEIEWVRELWGPEINVLLNGKATVGSAYNITAHVGYDLRAQMFLPSIRGAIAIDKGTAGQWDDVDTQWGGLFRDDDGLYVAAYLGDAGGSVVTIGLATASDPNGAWTKQGQIINVGPSGSTYETRFGASVLFKDTTELDPALRYKVIAKAYDAGLTGYVVLFTAAARTGPYTYRGILIPEDGTETQIAFRGLPVRYKGRWWFFYNADVAGATVLRASSCKRIAVGALVKRGTTIFTQGLAGYEAAITAVSGRTLTVGSTTGAVQDMAVVITNSAGADPYAFSRIRKVVNATTLELYHSVPGVNTSSVLRSANYGTDAALQQVLKIDDVWYFICTIFKTFTSHPTLGAHFESNGVMEGGATPFDTPALLWDAMPVVPFGIDAWNTTVSNENIRVSQPVVHFTDRMTPRRRHRSTLLRR